ncbi:lipoyl(octanoyl) transferase LipB [Candidatus Omnitrophota bacterium]
MRFVDLGLTGFLEAYKIQMELLGDISRGFSESTLLITEHPSVITVGRRGSHNNIFRSREFLCSRGIEVLDTDRGGDVTYHGPGQLVAYPVFKLENEARDIHRFLEYLENVARHFLSKYDVAGEFKPGLRGVWIKKKKIASIGIGVKKWVSYHGLAININCNLLPFSFIKPCGIEKIETTSLEKVLGYKVGINDAKYRLKSSFEELGCQNLNNRREYGKIKAS